MIYNVLSNYGFQGIKLDKRLKSRFKSLLSNTMSNLQKPIYQLFGDENAATATYRLLDNDSFSFDKLLDSHHHFLNSKTFDDDIYLAIHDTTGVNYSGHLLTEGLGAAYGHKTSLGATTHTSLIASLSRIAIGIGSQITYTRIDGKETRRDSTDNEYENDTQSYRWFQGIKRTEEMKPVGKKFIHVADRESDIYPLILMCKERDFSFVFRAGQNRLIKDNDNKKFPVKIYETLQSSTILGTFDDAIPRRSHEQIAETVKTLIVRSANIDILKPTDCDEELTETCNVNVVYVSDTSNEIQWYLLTSEKIETLEDCKKIIDIYKTRWLIEQFHNVLKSGLELEEIQLQSFDSIEKMILIYSVLATQIMNLTYLARVNPEVSCDKHFTKLEYTVLYQTANKTKKKPERVPTVKEAVEYLGILAKTKIAKGKMPGLKSIWEGLIKLYTVVEFAMIYLEDL